ncbi:TPA: hypothetical protein ACWV58_005578, partial [Salmonella enterica subsp. enterica serovar Muenchen]
ERGLVIISLIKMKIDNMKEVPGKRAGAPQALTPCPFQEGTFLPGCSCPWWHQRRKKGLPANRQPLHKGASGMSESHQP